MESIVCVVVVPVIVLVDGVVPRPVTMGIQMVVIAAEQDFVWSSPNKDIF